MKTWSYDHWKHSKTAVFISDTNVRRLIFKYSCLALSLLVNFCESRTRTFCIWILPSLQEIIHQSLNSFWMSNVISDSQIDDTLQYWEKVSYESHVFIINYQSYIRFADRFFSNEPEVGEQLSLAVYTCFSLELNRTWIFFFFLLQL